jgi:tetratricopeptide (TPR) repeat protein
MSILKDQYNRQELPADDLSTRERQLLETHLDRERADRWRQLAGKPEPVFTGTVQQRKWLWWAVAATFVLGICWFSGVFNSSGVGNQMAVRTDLVNYPFESASVRGERNDHSAIRSAKAVDAYNRGDFQAALQAGSPDDHFFIGMCRLQLKDAAQALPEFEKALHTPENIGAEIYYYKGIALQDLGRNVEARAAFQQILESKSARPFYKKAAQERVEHLNTPPQ